MQKREGSPARVQSEWPPRGRGLPAHNMRAGRRLLRRESGEAAGENRFGGVVAKVLRGDLEVLSRDRVSVGLVFE